MTNDEILQAAKEVGAVVDVHMLGRHDNTVFTTGELERFAAIIEKRMIERITELETYLKSETKDKESAQESFGTIWSEWQRCEKRIIQLERQRDELLATLDVALENLRHHGDNCFVSDHYEGDPGAGCNCGIDGVTDYLISTIAGVKGEQ